MLLTTIAKAVRMYDAGQLTEHELKVCVFGLVTPETVSEVLAAIPEWLREEVIMDARMTPEGARFRAFHMTSTVLRTEAVREQHRQEMAAAEDRHRLGVMVVKAHAITNDLFR
jgi:hypothetical protein